MASSYSHSKICLRLAMRSNSDIVNSVTVALKSESVADHRC